MDPLMMSEMLISSYSDSTGPSGGEGGGGEGRGGGVEAVAVVRRCAPDVVFCNGPGTCVPVVFAAMLRRALGWSTPAVIFVESACRTRTLSLTGKILYHLRCADAMCVMWEGVHERYPRTDFIGRAL